MWERLRVLVMIKLPWGADRLRTPSIGKCVLQVEPRRDGVVARGGILTHGTYLEQLCLLEGHALEQ
jgi:hypothetical protein